MSVILVMRGVEKDYRGLRPLRVKLLELREGQNVALVGFDEVTAEVFVNLVTGATIPDAGEVHVFGRTTKSINDGDAWLSSLDQFGILSDRAVLLDQLTVAQNLAVPFSLHLEPIPDAVQADVQRLAREVRLDESDLPRPVGGLVPLARLRVRLARAIALNPRVLLSEHPTASLPAGDVPTAAADLAHVIALRQLAAVTLTADRTFAASVSQEVLILQPATGDLLAAAGWSGWLRRRRS